MAAHDKLCWAQETEERRYWTAHSEEMGSTAVKEAFPLGKASVIQIRLLCLVAPDSLAGLLFGLGFLGG